MWSLFVDTDFVYLESRRLYGTSARMDYLHLPLYLVTKLPDIDFFQCKKSLVMRHGRDWTLFAASLQRFGYDVIPTDRGMQPRTVSTIVLNLINKGHSVLLVTAADRIDDALLVQIVERKGLIRLATFGVETPSISVQTADSKQIHIETLLMDETWLWGPDNTRMRPTKYEP